MSTQNEQLMAELEALRRQCPAPMDPAGSHVPAAEAPVAAASPSPPAAAALDGSPINGQPSTVRCSAGWQRIPAGRNAHYAFMEKTDLPAPRMDGKPQPADIRDKFAVFLCRTSELSGVFRVEKRVGCSVDDNKRLSAEPAYDKYIHKYVGQDEWVMRLNGPELVGLGTGTSNMTYQGRCVYESAFALAVPGKYYLTLEWFREDYVGALYVRL